MQSVKPNHPGANALALKSALEADTIARATAVATSVAILEITSADDASMAADQRAAIKAGLKFIDQQLKEATAPINEALRVVRSWAAVPKANLEAAVTLLDSKLDAWEEEQKKLAAAELERQRAATQAAVVEATQEAELLGEEAPPAATIVVRAPVTITRGASGASTYKQTVSKCELMDPHEADPSWLKLDEAAAKAAFRAAIDRGDAEKPTEEGQRVRWRGVDFFVEKTRAGRG